MPRLRLHSVSGVCRGMLYLLIGLAVCEMIIINISIFYVYHSIKSEIAQLVGSKSSDSGVSFIDRILKVPTFRNLVYSGKSGGFMTLIQNTVERIFIVTENGNKTVAHSADSWFGRNQQQISFLALDVSSAGEVMFVIKRMHARTDGFFQKYTRMVIDVGANDGLMASNSFNLIQLGWDAILVEPQVSLLHQAQENLARYSDPYNEGQQKVFLVNAVLGAQDGMEDFVLTKDDQESHIFDDNPAREGDYDQSNQMIMKVPSMTVRTFARKYNVPTNFALLSIDAEGVGDKVLHQWIDAGFRPGYIMYEQLHNREPIVITAKYLRQNGYHYLAKLGWNYIYEHGTENITKT